MCGILGGINARITDELLLTISHRGPDRRDLVTQLCGDDTVTMGHTRLSIVDLSEAGNQPMTSADGNYTLIFNGEIYNHEELRRKLTFKDFRGHSDTETLLHLLIEFGERALPMLNGIFAFAFLDRRNHMLLLARDTYGVKPLYYSLDKNRLVFSSEIRPIALLLSPTIDLESLDILLNLRYVPSPRTLYSGICKIRPGHYSVFTFGNGEINETQHHYIKPVLRLSSLSFDEAVEEYGRTLDRAVCRQLMGDVEMGMMLSGGIDSAVVAGLASKHIGSKMKAFTVGFDSQYDVNEIDMAAETARHFGMEHHFIKMTADNFFETFAECSHIVEEPLATTSFIPMYFLSKLAAEHVKVVLTGQGADEPLGGYPKYQGELLHSLFPGFVFKLADKMVSVAGIKNEKIIRGARSLSISDDVDRFVNICSLFTAEEVHRMTGRDVNAVSAEMVDYFYRLTTDSRQPSVERLMSVDMRMDLPDDLLLYTDKITMNFSLECRVPMLDNELVELLQSFPSSYKLARGKTKIVHKAFATRMLPQSIINRPKLKFQSPTDIWFRDQAGFVESTLLSGKLIDYIDRNELKKIIEQHRQGYNREKQIFLLLSLNEWLNRI